AAARAAAGGPMRPSSAPCACTESCPGNKPVATNAAMARNWRMATICRAYRAGSVSRARGVLQVSSPLDHVQAGGRIEAERGPGKRGVALPLAEIDHALLAERVDELHLFQAARAEAQARGFERGAFAVARLQAEPFQAVGLAGLGDDVVAVQSLW